MGYLFFFAFLSFSQHFHDAGHLVGNADRLWTFGQAFLAVGTASGPGLYIGQCFSQTVCKLLPIKTSWKVCLVSSTR